LPSENHPNSRSERRSNPFSDSFGSGVLGANFGSANLAGADLWYADLSGARFSDAYLGSAKGTEQQLATCKSLEGATMPDGQKDEDWLKSKGSVEDG
jgi:uncharacterized protein YjbI with pentapeptide repeats